MKLFTSEDGDSMFIASDGTAFSGENAKNECRLHEQREAVNGAVFDYEMGLKNAGLPDKVVSRYSAAARTYLLWTVDGSLPEYKPREKKAKPKAVPKGKAAAA